MLYDVFNLHEDNHAKIVVEKGGEWSGSLTVGKM